MERQTESHLITSTVQGGTSSELFGKLSTRTVRTLVKHSCNIACNTRSRPVHAYIQQFYITLGAPHIHEQSSLHSIMPSVQCSDTVGWITGRASDL